MIPMAPDQPLLIHQILTVRRLKAIPFGVLIARKESVLKNNCWDLDNYETIYFCSVCTNIF